jgi:hypothetical protein
MRKTIHSLLTFLLRWSEVTYMLPLAVLIWLLSNSVFRAVDETAGVYDIGIFQNPLVGIVIGVVLHAFVRIIMKLQWPAVDRYLDEVFSKDFQSATPFQRLALSVFIFFSLLLTFAILSQL